MLQSAMKDNAMHPGEQALWLPGWHYLPRLLSFLTRFITGIIVYLDSIPDPAAQTLNEALHKALSVLPVRVAALEWLANASGEGYRGGRAAPALNRPPKSSPQSDHGSP